MSRGALSQPVDADAQRGLPGADLVREPEYFLLDELVIKFRFDVTAPKKPRAACWNWLRRKGVPIVRGCLVNREHLRVALEGE